MGNSIKLKNKNQISDWLFVKYFLSALDNIFKSAGF